MMYCLWWWHRNTTVSDASYCYRCSVICVYVLVTLVNRAKTHGLVEMPFQIWTRVEPRDRVLGGSPDPQGGVILSDEAFAWLSVWSEVQIVCIWSTWCHCIPKPSFESRLVLPSGTGLPRLSWKRVLLLLVVSQVCSCTLLTSFNMNI